MKEFNFYVKGDKSRKWTVHAHTYTEARVLAETASGISKSKLIGYKVAIKKNPSRASVIYAQRKGRKGEVMYYDGRKFTNNNVPKYFGTHDRARGVAQQLVSRHAVLSQYRIWVGPPLPVLRRRNPESREAGLEEAARRLEDFSGHAVRRTITVRPRSNSREGLVIGELDLIGYRTKRDGIGGGKLLRYAHDFTRGSRPLLAVSKDGKQLHIVGGQYEFTEAGIEDR